MLTQHESKVREILHLDEVIMKDGKTQGKPEIPGPVTDLIERCESLLAASGKQSGFQKRDLVVMIALAEKLGGAASALEKKDAPAPVSSDLEKRIGEAFAKLEKKVDDLEYVVLNDGKAEDADEDEAAE